VQSCLYQQHPRLLTHITVSELIFATTVPVLTWVMLCQDLSFHKHINNIVSKVRFRVSILIRGFISRDSGIMRRAFIAFICSILEYTSVVWSSSLLCLIELLESVQRSFSKRLPSLSSLTYTERLVVLNVETLELRRLRFDLIFYYKVFCHLTPFDPDFVFIIYSPPNCLRSNEPFILKPITVPNKFLSTTFYRAIDAWNYLPIELHLSKSLPVFKRGLKVVDFIWSGVLITVFRPSYPQCMHALLFLFSVELKYYLLHILVNE
jgi:hypothetical protein